MAGVHATVKCALVGAELRVDEPCCQTAAPHEPLNVPLYACRVMSCSSVSMCEIQA